MSDIQLGSWVKIGDTDQVGVVIHIYKPPPDECVEGHDLRAVVFINNMFPVHRISALTKMEPSCRDHVLGLDNIGSDSPITRYLTKAALLQREDALAQIVYLRRLVKQNIVKIRTIVDQILDDQLWKSQLAEELQELSHQYQRTSVAVTLAAEYDVKLCALQNYLRKVEKAGCDVSLV
jgi:hypothetical protein